MVGLGVAIGTLLYLPLSFQRVGSIPLRFDAAAVLGWGSAILVLGVVELAGSRPGASLRIEPAEALTGGGVGT